MTLYSKYAWKNKYAQKTLENLCQHLLVSGCLANTLTFLSSDFFICVMCHVSCVMCHVSCVMCHVSASARVGLLGGRTSPVGCEFHTGLGLAGFRV